jgi:hypothetical protein
MNAGFCQKKRAARMKNVQMGAKIKREKEGRRTEASAQARGKMNSTDLSNIRMNEVNETEE